MTFKKMSGGAWSNPTAVKRRASGSWTDVGFVKAKESGAWVLVWPILAASLSTQYVEAAGGSSGGATATYRIGSDGSVYSKLGTASFTSLETWLDAGSNTHFEVRFTETSSNGIGSATVTTGTWLATTANNDITVSGAVIGTTASRAYLVEIRNVFDGVVMTSASISVSAERF